MKYVNYSIKLSPYRQFCCPLSLISALSSANIPVSPRLFGECDTLTFTARHFEKPLIPSSTQPTRKPPKASLKPLGRKRLGRCEEICAFGQKEKGAEKAIAIVFQIRLQLVRAKSSFQFPRQNLI